MNQTVVEDRKVRLFDDFQYENLESITIQSRTDKIELIKTVAGWQIGYPYLVPVYPKILKSTMLDILQAPRGQIVELHNNDYDNLSLLPVNATPKGSKSTPIEVLMAFSGGIPDVHFVLGAYSFPDDEEALILHGESGTARRYIRDLISDTTYLTPSSFQSIIPESTSWESRELIKAKRLQFLEVTAADGTQWTTSKSSSYSPIKFHPPHDNHSQSEVFAGVYDNLYSLNYHGGTLSKIQEQDFHEETPLLTIKAKDKINNQYVMTVMAVSDLFDANKMAPLNLRGGVIGVAADSKDKEYVVELEIIPSSLEPKKEEITAHLKGRLLLFPGTEIDTLITMTKLIKLRSNN